MNCGIVRTLDSSFLRNPIFIGKMKNSIRIIEKPEWISWKMIKDCLVEAHADNLKKGIKMLHMGLSSEEIKDKIGSNGFVLVALDGEKLVGTAAILEKNSSLWYTNGPYAYLGFAGIIPEYRGMGIYKELTTKRESYARQKGFSVIVFNTNEKNERVQNVAKQNGYLYVNYTLSSTRDHYDVYMAKWLGSCPFTKSYCRRRFLISRMKAHIRRLLSEIKQK